MEVHKLCDVGTRSPDHPMARSPDPYAPAGIFTIFF